MHELRFRSRLRNVSTLGCAYTLCLAACQGTAGKDAGQGPDGTGSTGSHRAALTSATSCGPLLERLQGELLDQVDERAEQARRGATNNYYPYPQGGGSVPAVEDGAPLPASPPPPSLGNTPTVPANDAPSGTASPDGSGFSETTVQVPGVDEADFVKAEGDRLYLLHGQSLYVLGAWPADATTLLGAQEIEGEAADLFVHDDKVVVFSRISGSLPGESDNIFPSYYYYYPTYTKLTVLDVSSGTPEVLRESYVEGYYGSSRRHDGVVRTVMQHGVKAALDYPSVSYVDLFGHPRPQDQIDQQVELWVDLTTESIDASGLEDYLPARFERVDGRLQRQPFRCADYWWPAVGLTQAGLSSLVVLDLDELQDPLRSVSVLGQAERMYANDEALLLTQTDYRYYTGASNSLETSIHRFNLDGARTSYAASGSVAGYIQSQFSLDEQGGVIRVSTTENDWNRSLLPIDPALGQLPIEPQGPVSRVVTLGSQGNRLVELGRTPDFGAGEQIYATRFLGDRGYVVTFRQIDPVFVVDLADPTAPAVAGELTIPGFSNFLYPLPDHHLLATGQDADERGVPLGVSLQIFDVRDANAPRLAHKYVFEGQGYSAANIDSRNISFHPEQDLVSFPYQDYTTGQSTLEVFHVSTSAGFTRVGGVRPSSAQPTLADCLVLLGYPQDPYYLEQLSQDPSYSQYLLDQCRYYNQETFRRGVFRDDTVFAISTSRVAAYALDDLAGEPEGEVELPATYPYYYGGGAMAGGAGAAGAAGGANMGGAAGSSALPPDGAMAGAAGGGGVGMGGAAGSASFPEPGGAMAGFAGEGGASFD